jgi:hypothetical protein
MSFEFLRHINEKRSGVGIARAEAIPAMVLLLPTALLHNGRMQKPYLGLGNCSG